MGILSHVLKHFSPRRVDRDATCRAGSATAARGYNDGAEDHAMPLRDHFRPPLDDIGSWEELHGAWPTVIVMALNRKLPPRYVAAPRVHLGPYMEIDVSAYDKDERAAFAATGPAGERKAASRPRCGRRRDPRWMSSRTCRTRMSTRSGSTTRSGTAAWSRLWRSSAPPTRTGPRTAVRS